MLTKKTPKNAKNFYCNKCDFICSKQSEWDRHLITRKHKIVAIVDKNIVQKTPNIIAMFTCECGKGYSHRQSLSFHKKKCEYSNQISDVIESDKDKKVDYNEKDVILLLLNQNNQLQNQIMTMCKERTNTSINNGNINSNNKTFNLNVFLNEECKDAMNIMDFVDSLQIQLADLEKVGKLGFVEGITNLIVKNLQALDVHKRPVHCSDTKREILYVKDENKWEKENQENKRLKRAIKHIAHKNSKMLPEFKAKYPDCVFSDSNKSDEYNKIIIESMGGLGNDDEDNENKIIKKLAKEVIIAKVENTK
jgi:hypothetical protein